MKHSISLSIIWHNILLVQVSDTNIDKVSSLDLPEKFKQLYTKAKELVTRKDFNLETEECLYTLTITPNTEGINAAIQVFQWSGFEGEDIPIDLQYNPIQRVKKYFLETYPHLPVQDISEEVILVKVPDSLDLKGTIIQDISPIPGIDYTATPITTGDNKKDYNLIMVIRTF